MAEQKKSIFILVEKNNVENMERWKVVLWINMMVLRV